jgi:hypothetical protein
MMDGASYLEAALPCTDRGSDVIGFLAVSSTFVSIKAKDIYRTFQAVAIRSNNNKYRSVQIDKSPKHQGFSPGVRLCGSDQLVPLRT